MISNILKVILIKVGFKTDPTVDPTFRLKSQKDHLIIFLVLILYLFISPELLGTACLIQGFCGFPCPTCGSTRAFFSLMRGDWRQALYWHPLIFLSLAIILIIFIVNIRRDVLRLKSFQAGESLHFTEPKNKTWKIFIPIFILYLAVYIYRLINFFPQVPMNYNYSSILGRLYLFLKNFFD